MFISIDRVLPREIFNFEKFNFAKESMFANRTSDILFKASIFGRLSIVRLNCKRQESTLNHFLQKGKCLLEIQFYKKKTMPVLMTGHML